jgi:hypothetical protein
MRKIALGVGGFAIAITSVVATPLAAQKTYELGPNQPHGQIVAPYFEGWFANPDGTYTLAFGYFNANTEEVLEIPLGPDNFITPSRFDGVQPTYFPPVNYGGFSARRERGVFAITIPAEMAGEDVVWTIRSQGQVASVPGRVTSPAYELGLTPMAMGSKPPSVRLDTAGPVGNGPSGVFARNTLQTRVSVPVELTFWAADDQSEREEAYPLGVTWFKHQGPGEVTFGSRTSMLAVDGDGHGGTTATFSGPGEYVVRVRVDNHRARDSSPSNQCCWTNGYVRVNVTQ